MTATARAAGEAAVHEATILDALRDVHDPEIPGVSVVDLGVVGGIEATAGAIRVELLPTFVACPAIEPMRAAVAARLRRLAPGRRVDVELRYSPPWTADRITPEGRRRLAASGFAPPTLEPPSTALAVAEAPVPCPYCGSRRTVLESAFGPTACRSIRYCRDCRQPFEHFKSA